MVLSGLRIVFPPEFLKTITAIDVEDLKEYLMDRYLYPNYIPG